MKHLAILTVLSIIFYAIWRIGSPFPSPLNWDIWEHQTVINHIKQKTVALFPSQISDTFQFDGYTTAFHVLVAGAQSIFAPTSPLGFWYVAEGVFFILTTLATYAFVRALTNNGTIALVAGILSLGLYESAVAFSTLFLLPQTLASLLWLVGMTVVVSQKSQGRKLVAAIIASIVILPFHAIVGALGALFLFIMALEPRIHWALVVAISFLVPTFLATQFGLTGLNAGEAQYYTQTVGQKLSLMRSWYGFLPLVFLPFGIWKGNRTMVMLGAISIGLLASPFPYVLKFMVIIRYVMIALMATGVGMFLKYRAVALTVLTAAAAVLFYTNTTIWKQPVVFRGIASHVSQDEQDAASFLQARNSRGFLVSDPATQYILEALSGIDTQGGAYMNAVSRKDFLALLQSQEPVTVKEGTFVAISARTMKWLEASNEDQMSVAYNVWRSDALSVEDHVTIAAWQEKTGAHEIYTNDSVRIFTL